MGIRALRDELYNLQCGWTETRRADGHWDIVIADYDDDARVFGTFTLPGTTDDDARCQFANDLMRMCIAVRNAVADPVEAALRAMR